MKFSLIQQDLKHNQLIEGLKKLGFEDSGLHSLNILPMIASLMEIPLENVSDRWSDVYSEYIALAPQYKITGLAENLLPLAERCYDSLINSREDE